MPCKNCGKCCVEMGHKIYATSEDILRWIKEGRQDILKHVLVYEYYDLSSGYIVEGGEIWFDENGRKLEKCPFIEEKEGKVYCKIHETKPLQCREYRCW